MSVLQHIIKAEHGTLEGTQAYTGANTLGYEMEVCLGLCMLVNEGLQALGPSRVGKIHKNKDNEKLVLHNGKSLIKSLSEMVCN